MMKRTFLATLVVAAAVTVTGCVNNDPFGSGNDANTITIGSQDYYSNEIIAEIYAQALEKDGHNVDRQFRIGQREAYLPEIEAGAIDLFPEYTGPLLQYWSPNTGARLPDAVYTDLSAAVPPGLRVLEQSPATDQDAYTVTREFSEKYRVSTIGDLRNVPTPLTLGANSEAESRPYGPQGLESTYGVAVKFSPIEDSGGPLTVRALRDGDIQLAIIYTADPSVEKNNLVSLTDTEGLFVASHVVPLASDDVDVDASATINAISTAMTPEDLMMLNSRSVNEKLPASRIATDWLESKGL